MSEKTHVLKGVLSVREWGEGEHETLYCDNERVTEWAMEIVGNGDRVVPNQWGSPNNLMVMTQEECDRRTREYPGNRWITVRYWIADQKAKPDEIKKRALECLYGLAEVDWGAAYSEITGYLWTDDKFKIGGHDMDGRLREHVGKYLLLELVKHNGPQLPAPQGSPQT